MVYLYCKFQKEGQKRGGKFTWYGRYHHSKKTKQNKTYTGHLRRIGTFVSGLYSPRAGGLRAIFTKDKSKSLPVVRVLERVQKRKKKIGESGTSGFQRGAGRRS